MKYWSKLLYKCVRFSVSEFSRFIIYLKFDSQLSEFKLKKKQNKKLFINVKAGGNENKNLPLAFIISST